MIRVHALFNRSTHHPIVNSPTLLTYSTGKTATYLLMTLFIIQASAMAVLLSLLIKLLHGRLFLFANRIALSLHWQSKHSYLDLRAALCSSYPDGSLSFGMLSTRVQYMLGHLRFAIRLPTVLVGLLLLFLTVYKAIQFRRMSRNGGGSRLFQTLVRDQIMYFVGYAFHLMINLKTFDANSPLLPCSIFLVSGANMIAVSLEPLLICVAVGFNIGFPLLMGSRLLLNLREMAEEDLVLGMSVKNTTLTAIRFASGQVATLRTQQIAQSNVPSVYT